MHHLDQVGWRAVPIILLITFLIGASSRSRASSISASSAPTSIVVDMVGILVLREIGVLIVAIMVAGRSGSAYTAELGSMKMREEIDALRTMGFDPIEVLILPRILALVIALPILTFLGSMAALYGGGLVCWLYGGIDAGRVPAAAAGGDLDRPFHRRHDQGAVHGAGDRHRRLRRGPAVKGSAESLGLQDHRLGGEVDLPRHRARRPVRHLLRLDRDVSDGAEGEQPSARHPGARPRGRLRRRGRARRPSISTSYRGEILGFVGAVRRRQVGADAHHHRPGAEARRHASRCSGVDLDARPARRRGAAIERRWGILFQQGALFSSLTVRQNIQFPMREYLDLSQRLLDEIALAKLDMVGLTPDVVRQVIPRNCPAA